jgi:hypothetical protein
VVRRRTKLSALLAIAAAALMVGAGNAGANFHLTKVREISTGSSTDTSYVELQAWTAGQNYLGGHTIKLYNGTSLTHTFTFPSVPVPVVPNGASQSTVLVGDANAPGTPDFTESGFVLNAAAGAACFDSVPVDCVSWGTGTSASLPGAAGTPASALSSGMALTRTIAPGCPTLLESGDDSDNSAADFALGSPNPRNNSVTPTETTCAPTGAGSGPSGYPTPTSSPKTTPKKKCKKHKRSAAAAKKCKKRKY